MPWRASSAVNERKLLRMTFLYQWCQAKGMDGGAALDNLFLLIFDIGVIKWYITGGIFQAI